MKKQKIEKNILMLLIIEIINLTRAIQKVKYFL